MSTDINGLPAFGGLSGFGGSFTPLVDITEPFNISDHEQQYAFMVPADGTLTRFSAFFSSSTASNFPGNVVSVQAQLWISTGPDNIFNPVTGSLLTLSPSYFDGQPNGTFASGSLVINQPVAMNDRLMLLYKIISANPTEVTLNGFVSAGVIIE